MPFTGSAATPAVSRKRSSCVHRPVLPRRGALCTDCYVLAHSEVLPSRTSAPSVVFRRSLRCYEAPFSDGGRSGGGRSRSAYWRSASCRGRPTWSDASRVQLTSGGYNCTSCRHVTASTAGAASTSERGGHHTTLRQNSLTLVCCSHSFEGQVSSC